MIRNPVWVLLLLIVIGFTTTKADQNPNLGKTAPDFKLKDLSDHVVKLSDFKGKNVILVFYVGSG